jgi:hypothetical protein
MITAFQAAATRREAAATGRSTRSLKRPGQRVGFWNPTIYAAAVGCDSPFWFKGQAMNSEG